MASPEHPGQAEVAPLRCLRRLKGLTAEFRSFLADTLGEALAVNGGPDEPAGGSGLAQCPYPFEAPIRCSMSHPGIDERLELSILIPR
jgi:hypothetical protein